MRIRPSAWAVLVVGTALACSRTPDPSALLEDRARYQVELVSWVARPDGRIAATLRVRGPVRTRLDRLTVEIVRFGWGGERIGSDWVSLELGERPSGLTVEKVVVLPGEPMPEALGVDLHAHPAPEILSRLKELQPPSSR